jgi:hypothetical protein
LQQLHQLAHKHSLSAGRHRRNITWVLMLGCKSSAAARFHINCTDIAAWQLQALVVLHSSVQRTPRYSAGLQFTVSMTATLQHS